MKNVQDIKNRLETELKHWFNIQCRDCSKAFYLYYLPANNRHDGGILIASESPANPEYKLVTPERISINKTVEALTIQYLQMFMRLPILTVN